jgi:hypothetical protein
MPTTQDAISAAATARRSIPGDRPLLKTALAPRLGTCVIPPRPTGLGALVEQQHRVGSDNREQVRFPRLQRVLVAVLG